MLSLLLFLVVLDWVTRTAYASSGKGIQWTFLRRLENLEFADDLALLSHRLQDVQDKVNALSETAQRVGPKDQPRKNKAPKYEQPARGPSHHRRCSSGRCQGACVSWQQDEQDMRDI